MTELAPRATVNVKAIPGTALQAERLALSGDVAAVQLEIESRAAEEEKLWEALSDEDLQSNLQSGFDAQVRTGFGKEYGVGPLQFAEHGPGVTAVIRTAYAEIGGPEEIMPKVGRLAKTMALELEKLLGQKLEDDVDVAIHSTSGLVSQLEQSVRPVSAESPEEDLRAELERLQARRRQHQRSRARGLLIMVLAGFSTPIVGIVIGVFAKNPLAGVIAGVYVFFFAATGFAAWLMSGSHLADAETELQQITDELDLRDIGTEALEPRAQKLFQAHGSELRRYYEQALRQAKHVYYVGVASILLGVAVIGAAFALILGGGADDLQQQVIVGSLGAIGAVMSNFIAVIYLRMFSDTVSALTGFHGRLVTTHHLHFGNFLASKIAADDIRDQALARMAEALSAGHLDTTQNVQDRPPTPAAAAAEPSKKS